MERNIKLSVIIPVYNQEVYIARCLESVLQKDFLNSLEVIVVDDGSSDQSSVIVRKYIQKYPDIIKLVYQTNKGLGGARNTGVENAHGKYIWFVDSDDTISEGALRELYQEAEKKNVQVLLFDMDEVKENGEFICHSNSYEGIKEYEVFSTKDTKNVLCGLHSASNKIIDREFYVSCNVKFPEHMCFEDLMTIPKILVQATRIEYINKSFYNYYQNAGSILHSGNVDKYKDIVDVVNDIYTYFVNKKLIQEFREELEYILVYNAYLMVSARIIKVDYKCEILYQLRDNIKNKFRNFYNNSYVKKMSIKHKISLRFMDMGLYNIIYIGMKTY